MYATADMFMYDIGVICCLHENPLAQHPPCWILPEVAPFQAGRADSPKYSSLPLCQGSSHMHSGRWTVYFDPSPQIPSSSSKFYARARFVHMHSWPARWREVLPLCFPKRPADPVTMAYGRAVQPVKNMSQPTNHPIGETKICVKYFKTSTTELVNYQFLAQCEGVASIGIPLHSQATLLHETWSTQSLSIPISPWLPRTDSENLDTSIIL